MPKKAKNMAPPKVVSSVGRGTRNKTRKMRDNIGNLQTHKSKYH